HVAVHEEEPARHAAVGRFPTLVRLLPFRVRPRPLDAPRTGPPPVHPPHGERPGVRALAVRPGFRAERRGGGAGRRGRRPGRRCRGTAAVHQALPLTAGAYPSSWIAASSQAVTRRTGSGTSLESAAIPRRRSSP